MVVHDKLMEERRVRLEQHAAQHHIPFEVDSALIEKLAHKGNVYALGVFEKYESPLSAGNHLMLVHPSGLGNVGTILRTMVAFGVRDLALIRPAADVFNPHVVRAAIGANFLVNVEYFEGLEPYREKFAHRLYPFFLEAQTPLDEAQFTPPFTLVFGPEWPGLPVSYREAGTGVVIPQDSAAESLNLGVAVGVALYQARLS